MGLIQLIYVSSASKLLDAAELERILATSRQHNTPAHITGMLLYAEGSFIQVLEGEEADVLHTYQRIDKDPRHRNLIVIERAPIGERQFSQWHMGFRSLSEADAAEHPGYAPFFKRGFDAATLGAQPGTALAMLLNFRLTMR